MSQIDSEILSDIFSFIACIGLWPLLFLEHSRSIKPSDLAVVYLLISLACNSIELGVTVYEKGTWAYVMCDLGMIVFKLMLIATESRDKRSILREAYSQWPPEQLAGILGRATFWWINPILVSGYGNILTANDLPPLDHDLSSMLLRQRALRAWDQRGIP